jgi:hypothetical protein
MKEVVRAACPSCPAFYIEKIKDTSSAKYYLKISVVSGILLISTALYLDKKKFE